jgi:methylenetetrahydrofolate reductase (NADPH)
MLSTLPVRRGNTRSLGVDGSSETGGSAEVMQIGSTPALDVRYEVLPFGSVEREATIVSKPLTLTVTCSPKSGMDAALDVACRLGELGHRVILHLAARMIRGPEHLDALLERMADARIVDVFLIAGDADVPLGPYSSGLDLIGELRRHRNAPRSIGVPAYPEGHPLIDEDTLAASLLAKAPDADYMTTQICFDPDVLLSWLKATRASGVDLPVYAGIPGSVDRRRLMEVSFRVGVGASIRFLRKQRGVRRLLGRTTDAGEQLAAAIAPLIGTELGVAGLHFFTFNQLLETKRFVDLRLAEWTANAAPMDGAHSGDSQYRPDQVPQPESQRT